MSGGKQNGGVKGKRAKTEIHKNPSCFEREESSRKKADELVHVWALPRTGQSDNQASH